MRLAEDNPPRQPISTEGPMARVSVRGPAALLAAGVLLLLSAPLQAGPLFVPGQLEGDKFTPAPGVPCHCASIRYSSSTVTVEDATASVLVEETIEGPEKGVAAVCLIPLPEGTDGAAVKVAFGPAGAPVL